MAGQSAFGNVMRAGAAAVASSKMNRRTGPSNKNLGPSRVSRPNPAPMIRSKVGMSIKGPDKGAGGM